MDVGKGDPEDRMVGQPQAWSAGAAGIHWQMLQCPNETAMAKHKSVAFYLLQSCLLLGAAMPLHAGTIAPEVQVTSADITAPQYDQQGRRMTFVNKSGELWLANLTSSGDLVPSDGRGQLLDVDAAYPKDFGYGPQWTFSSKSTQIVYTKYAAGQPKSSKSASSAVARLQPDGFWTAGFISGSEQSHSPVGSANSNDKSIYINYQGVSGKSIYWRLLTGSDPTVHLVPNSDTADNVRNWVAGTHSILFTASADMPDGSKTQQVFLYSADNNSLTQLTFDSGSKFGGQMWKDPDLKELVFFTMVDRTALRVYRQATSGAWIVWKTISMPAKLPYVWSPQVLVSSKVSYIVMQVSSSINTNDMTVPTQLAISGINPEKSNFRMLTNDSSPKRVRVAPEIFVTDAGPQVYYNRFKPASGSAGAQSEGIWRLSTGL